MTTAPPNTANIPDFNEIHAPAPAFDDVAAEYAAIRHDLSGATDTKGRLAAIHRWDRLRRRLSTWLSLTTLRSRQDTRNDEFKKAREHCDELRPKITNLDVQVMRDLLGHADRTELQAQLGKQAFDLWDAEIATFDPAIEPHLVEQSKLTAKYTELCAAAKFEFRGETLNLSTIGKYTTDADRQTRYDANKIRWQFFTDNAAEFDAIFADLVRLRTDMAKALGDDNYIPFGYRHMQRIDYGQAEVEKFRAEVREHVVPLAQEIRNRQAKKLGVDAVKFWDEGVFDPEGNPKPNSDHDWMLEQAQTMFDRIGPELGDFFRLMTGKHLLDLQSREGKAGGGFCTAFADYGLPYIFANFNGTDGDVRVFTHEMGHAFQGWMSRNQPIVDYHWPTMESAEIHSMSLEFITWPHLDLFFGDDAERFRQHHLIGSLIFLPYGVAVDHFQHLIYENPAASAADRHAMWREMETTYMPWRDGGDIEFLAKGGQWQAQRHIYASPFYYIDYTLALTCAMQFWVRSREDFATAMRDYIALCRRGGEAPFRTLTKHAGLTSPFEPGCLAGVVDTARAALTW